MIRMGFYGISGKRLWIKSGRHIIKPNHGVEQTPKIEPFIKKKFMNGSHFFLPTEAFDAGENPLNYGLTFNLLAICFAARMPDWYAP